jgi:AraC-like DNA-binding protein
MVQKGRTGAVKRTEMPKASLEDQVGSALRVIQDLSALNRSPLARIAHVENLARDQYQRHILPRGLALRAVLASCVDQVINDLSGEPALKRQCDYLRMIKDGVRCKEISRSLGCSREHVSRKYRREALALLSEAFQRRTRRGQ